VVNRRVLPDRWSLYFRVIRRISLCDCSGLAICHFRLSVFNTWQLIEVAVVCCIYASNRKVAAGCWINLLSNSLLFSFLLHTFARIWNCAVGGVFSDDHYCSCQFHVPENRFHHVLVWARVHLTYLACEGLSGQANNALPHCAALDSNATFYHLFMWMSMICKRIDKWKSTEIICHYKEITNGNLIVVL